MDSKQQSKKIAPTVLKATVKNAKKLIDVDDVSSVTSKPPRRLSEKMNEPKLSKDNATKKKTLKIYPDRGVVYLAHIPHGFYEAEMKSFFKQFGHITRIRLVRSNKTGNSRGYAFIEFRFKEVAQVVAETMNNYLFGNRLLKAVFIPPEKQNPKMFLHGVGYSPETCIGVKRRREAIAQQNKPLTEAINKVRIDRGKNHLLELQEKLKAQGVDCLFQVNSGPGKRLPEETNSLPSSKRVRTSSPTPKAKSSKTTEQKQSLPAPTLKKKSTTINGTEQKQSGPTLKIKKKLATSNGQVSEKRVKPSYGKKAAKESLIAQGKGKVEKKVEKKSVKKPIVKKVVKQVVTKMNGTKVATSKKDVAKKSVPKKQAAKKK